MQENLEKTMAILNSFTEYNENRIFTQYIQQFDDYIMSTNGMMMVRCEGQLVNKLEECEKINESNLKTLGNFLKLSKGKFDLVMDTSELKKSLVLHKKTEKKSLESTNCKTCDGSGRVDYIYHVGDVYDEKELECPTCYGNGSTVNNSDEYRDFRFTPFQVVELFEDVYFDIINLYKLYILGEKISFELLEDNNVYFKSGKFDGILMKKFVNEESELEKIKL